MIMLRVSGSREWCNPVNNTLAFESLISAGKDLDSDFSKFLDSKSAADEDNNLNSSVERDSKAESLTLIFYWNILIATIN